MKNIFKTIFGGLDKGIELGAKLHIPVVDKIDAVKDLIQAHAKSGSVTTEQAIDIFKSLDQVQDGAVQAIETAKAMPTGQRGMLESKRFVAAVAGVLAVAAIYLGVPVDVADKLAPLVAAAIGAYLLGETVRPSVQ